MRLSDDLLHQTLVVQAVVTSQKSGTVRFLDHQAEMGSAQGRAVQYQEYPDGARIEIHFRMGGEKPHILFVTEATKVMVAEPEEIPAVAVAKPEDKIPEWHNGHYFSLDTRKGLGALKAIIDEGGIANALMRGGSGYGKTSTFQKFAEMNGMDYVYIDCATTLDAEQWFGYHEAREGDTVFIPSRFTEACQKGNTVIVLDEANRIEAWIANPLFPILDDRRAITVHGMDVKVSPKTLFGLTVNEGPQYAGTHQLDKAFINRMDVFMIAAPMPRKTETELLVKRGNLDYGTADRIIGYLNTMRQTIERDRLDIDVSTRTALKLAKLLKAGMTMSEAFTYAVVNAIQTEDAKPIIDILRNAGIS